MKMDKKTIMSKRGKIAAAAISVWFFLAAWSLSAFFQHIDELGVTYRSGSYIGAAGTEFIILVMILFHCFDKHIGVRFWAVIFSFLLGAIVLAHTGAIRGMAEATSAQIATEKRMANTLAEMGNKQAGSIKADQTGTQKERLAKNRAAVQQQGELAKAAQREVAANIAASAETVKDSSIMPRWYVNGWMYGVMFIAGLLLLTVLFLLMLRDDVDADFDGVIDTPKPVQRTATMSPPIQVTAKTPNTTFTSNGGNPPTSF
jgi:hypothetical protein